MTFAFAFCCGSAAATGARRCETNFINFEDGTPALLHADATPSGPINMLYATRPLLGSSVRELDGREMLTLRADGVSGPHHALELIRTWFPEDPTLTVEIHLYQYGILVPGTGTFEARVTGTPSRLSSAFAKTRLRLLAGRPSEQGLFRVVISADDPRAPIVIWGNTRNLPENEGIVGLEFPRAVAHEGPVRAGLEKFMKRVATHPRVRTHFAEMYDLIVPPPQAM